jgi:hypothetical protein
VNTIYRQGDVLIIKATSPFPAGTSEVPRDHGRIVLAYGEVTGHAHAIADAGAVLLAAPDTEDRFLRIMDASGVELQHEEHATITLEPGDYVVRRQREYSSADMAPVRVAD